MRDVKVVILGAGSAGLSARSEVAKRTDSYVVIDPGPLGTTCARVGCMPSKALIQVASDFHRRHALAGMGISGGDGLAVDPAAALAHVRRLRDRFVGSVIDGMEDWRERLIEAPARFVDERTLEAGGERIRAERIVIATGARPIVPESWSGHRDHLIDTDTIFDLETLPKRMAVVGLGPVGLELGQALARLGVEVHAIDPERGLGRLSSPELQDLAVEIMERELDIVFEMAEPEGPGPEGFRVRAGERTLCVDKVLLAIGRAPNLDGLALENAGIERNEDGTLPIDPATLRIGDTGIFIAGDVNGLRPVLHEAVDEGRIAGFNAVRGDDSACGRRPQMSITFSDPDIAIVGQGHRALTDSGSDFVTGKVSYAHQGRAMVMGEATGAAEIYLDRASGRLLGAEMIAPGAEHLAHFLGAMLAFEATVQDILGCPFYHPVLEEGLRTALKRGASQVEAEISATDMMRCEEPPAGAVA